MIHYLKRLKNISLYKLIFILLFCFIYVYFYNINYKSKYKDEKIIYGYITNYIIDEDKTTIYLKGKEKIICIYNNNDFNYKLGDYIVLNGNLEIPNTNTIFKLTGIAADNTGVDSVSIVIKNAAGTATTITPAKSRASTPSPSLPTLQKSR